MPHWLLKSAIHRAISWMPATHKWNELFQTYVTRSLRMNDDYFAGLVRHAARHLDVRFRLAGNGEFNALEIGTGWFPAAPVAAVLCGAKTVWTFDISPLLDRERIATMLGYFRAFAADGRLAKLLPALLPEKLALLDGPTDGEPAETLRRLGIEYLVRDARKTELPADSVDFVFSHSVFQYIPKEMLAEMLREFQRIARRGIVHSHHIHPGSEFAYFDRTLSPLHFYAYGEKAWGWLDSAINRQTRLCMPDYREVFREGGLAIRHEENSLRDLTDLSAMKLAPRFASYDPEELRIFSTWIEATAD